MRKRRKMQTSELRCPKCGELFFIPRRSGKLRKKGHVKTMWCPWCKDMRDFKEGS